MNITPLEIRQKEFEKGFSLIDPEQNIKLSQYMLEVSVTDGLLSSYAKLDAIKLKPIEKSNAKVIYEVKTKWITPLEKIENSSCFLKYIRHN